MLESGNWILPVNYGTDIAYKPPFFYWAIATVSSLLGGVTEYSSRLPSALAFLAMQLVFFSFIAKRKGVKTAFLASILLLSSFEVHRAAVACRVDMVQVSLIVISLCLLFSWTGNAVLSKEMERAYKNQALKEGAAADAVTFNENSENCYLDPRCEVLWFRPTPFDSLTTSPLPTENLKRDFNGVMNGETNVGGSYLNRYSANRCILSSDAMNKDYWWNLAREIVWMGYAESLFLKAEAALRWPSLVDETAEALYLKGIKASMDYYEIDADKANEYISHLDGVKAFAGGSKEEQLEQIITQKWIAVFPNGNEGWAEVRRTDYPRYLLAPVNGNNSNGEVASGKLIKRINYPNSESRNPNKPGNVNQGSRVWWDVADTMNDRGQWHTPNNFR